MELRPGRALPTAPAAGVAAVMRLEGGRHVVVVVEVVALQRGSRSQVAVPPTPPPPARGGGGHRAASGGGGQLVLHVDDLHRARGPWCLCRWCCLRRFVEATSIRRP